MPFLFDTKPSLHQVVFENFVLDELYGVTLGHTVTGTVPVYPRR